MTARTPETPDLNARHGLNPPHSEVVRACRVIKPGKALDMGCGAGRNALYLSQLGFDVTAVDANPSAIGMLRSIVEQEGIDNIEARVYDINRADLGTTYDFIACTVTLMFLDAARVDAVIADMQQCTRAGGHNLIVAAMSTDEYPCPMNFPFVLGTGQPSAAYAGWELLEWHASRREGGTHTGFQVSAA